MHPLITLIEKQQLSISATNAHGWMLCLQGELSTLLAAVNADKSLRHPTELLRILDLTLGALPSHTLVEVFHAIERSVEKVRK